jgi:hypothetical protein
MFGNWIKENTTTSGTGTMTLSAVTGFERFSDAFSVGDLVYYEIRDGNNREAGIGTLGASNTLARTTVLETLVAGTRSTAGTALTLSGGTAEVYCALMAQGVVNPRKGTSIAAATTTSIWNKDGDVVDISGNTTITSFGTAARAGMVRLLRFTGAPLLTHGANLALPGLANVQAAAGDLALVVSTSTTAHVVAFYQKADGNGVKSFVLADGSVTMTGPLALGNNNITNVNSVQFFGEYDNGNSSTSATLSPANGACQKITLNTAAPVLTLGSATAVGHYQFRLIQDATGGRQPTWAGSGYSASRWIGYVGAPAINTAAGAVTFVNGFWDGSAWWLALGPVNA